MKQKSHQDVHTAVGVVKLSPKDFRLFGSAQAHTEQKDMFTVIPKTVKEEFKEGN